MDRRQDQVILVEQRNSSLVASRIGGVQRKFCQEAFAGWISGRDLFELEQVRSSCFGVFVNAVEMRFVPKTSALQIDGPFRIPKIAQGFDEALPVVAGARWNRKGRECRDR